MVVQKSEIALIVHCAYQETRLGCQKIKGAYFASLQSLWIILLHHFKNLNIMKQPQKLKPLFQNKATLMPNKACRVQERHQVDLVSMASVCY